MTMTKPPKQLVAETLMSESTAFVHFDARREGVIVPPPISSQAHATLQFGLNMPVPIRDLVVDSTGIQGTLSFSRRPFYCNVPWSAVFALSDGSGRGYAWDRDAPAEFVESQKADHEATQRRAMFRLVK